MINTQNISSQLVISVTFNAFILFMLYFYLIKALNTRLDFFLAILAVIISLIILFSKNKTLLDFAHFLYCIVFLFTVTFISKNLYFLGLNILMISLIIYSRKHYKECILGRKHNNLGFFASIAEYLKKNISNWDFGYIFNILLFISFYRYVKLQ